MAKNRTNSKSILNVLGYITYKDTEMVNIFKKIGLNYSKLDNISYYDEYVIVEGDRWDRISNKLYNTPSLYWLILSFNKIKDPFTSLVVGNTIKVIKPNLIQSVLLELRNNE